MAISVNSADEADDLATCDREPIQIPGSIQPHGLLFVLEELSFRVEQASDNAGFYFSSDPVGKPISELLGGEWAKNFQSAIDGASLERVPLYLGDVTVGTGGREQACQTALHRLDGLLLLELEFAHSNQQLSFGDLYPLVRTFMAELQQVHNAEELTRLAAREVRRITGFDRVLIYRFDANWDGHVVAEDRDASLPPYLGLWFPASDIPRQARELYRLNRLRLISDANYKPVPITPSTNPRTGKPVDLSFAILRSVSPIHIEYLQNMGVGASMSISVLQDGELWGLIACHHRVARPVSFEIRTACDFLGQAFALQLAAAERTGEYEQRLHLKLIESQLLTFMAQEEHFVDGLVKHPSELLELVRAQGAAVLFNHKCTLIGTTPSEEVVNQLSDWLADNGHTEVFSSDEFSRLASDESYTKAAAGVLAISISKLYRSFVIWFRPEVIQTVTWAGDPAKRVEQDSTSGNVRIHPRKSFEAWRETVQGKALPWLKSELDTAADLRVSILEIVLRKAEELAHLSGELERTNKELEAFSYSVSHDLRAPFRHIVGYASLLKERVSAVQDDDVVRYVDTIIESAGSAGSLVDNLLHFAQIGRSALDFGLIAQSDLVNEVKAEMEHDLPAGRDIKWRVAALPTVRGDLVLLRLVWQNLLSNAVKYTRTRSHAEIEISCEETESEIIFFVRDNGVGFDARYTHKLFGVFQRLHRMEEFEGNGIGLANVRRIIARHGGRTWAEGAVGEGATFFFSLLKEVGAK